MPTPSDSRQSGRPNPEGRAAGAWRPEAKALLRLAVPLALTEVVSILITTIDFIMLGWHGEESLAAAALGLYWIWLVHLLGIGTLTAVGPIVAQALGAGSLRVVRRALRQGFWVALLLCPPIMLCLWQVEPILTAFGQDPALAALASDYVRAYTLGIPASLGTVVLWELFVTHERPKTPMVLAILALPLNAALNYVMIFGIGSWPGLGLTGAGLASAAVTWMFFAALLVATLRDRRFRRYAIFGRFWRPDWPRFREILSVGLPLGLGMAIETGFFSASTFMVGSFDPVYLAAHAVALQVAGLVYMTDYGLGQAASIRVALAAGAQRPERVRLSGNLAALMAIAAMIPVCLALYFLGPAVMPLFSEAGAEADPHFVARGAELLTVAAVFLVFDGLRTVLHGNLTGLKDTRVPMVVHAVSYWVVGLGTAWAFVILAGGGAMAIWGGICAGTAAGCGLLAWRWIGRSRGSGTGSAS